MIRRTTTAPCRTTGRSTALLSPMMATSGALMTGVEAMPPSLPRLVTVMVEPTSSSRVALFERARSDTRRISRGELPQAERLRIAHHRHLESVRRLGRHADMDGAVSHQHAAGGVIEHVALRKGLEHAHQRQNDQRQVSQGGLALRNFGVQMLPQGVEFRDVHFFYIGEMRNVALGLAHALGNQPAHADHLDLRGIRRGRRRGRHRGAPAPGRASAPDPAAAGRPGAAIKSSRRCGPRVPNPQCS